MLKSSRGTTVAAVPVVNKAVHGRIGPFIGNYVVDSSGCSTLTEDALMCTSLLLPTYWNII